MPTISDVAKYANVSMKTVSRVLNREAYVRDEVRQRVEAAVAELGYRPSLAARQLAGKRSFIIAYPFNNPSAAYNADVLMGAARSCRDNGYHLVSEPVEVDDTMVVMIERLLRALRPDGVILTPPLCDAPEVVELVARFEVPLVRIAGSLPLYGRSVTIDDSEISEELVAHLVAQGHRRIAFIMPHPDHRLAQRRYDGYRAGLRHAGIAFDPELVEPGRFDFASGAIAARALLDLALPPTAIFAANDDMALGALRVANERGLAVPGQIAIAGFDDSPASRLVWPELTTIRQPTEQMGAMAARILLGEDDDGIMRNALIVRRSTAEELTALP